MTQDLSAAGCLVLAGPLTMRTSDTILPQLRETIAANQRVVIDCCGAEDIDLTFIQMLIAARHTAQLAGKSVSLAAPAKGALLATLNRAGFIASEATSPADGNKGFWFEAVKT